MTAPPTPRYKPTQRDMLFLANTDLWPCWPFLAVLRRHPDDGQELGVMYDAKGASGLYGYSATVWLTNVFRLPRTEDEFLKLPRRVYDSLDELAGDGWTVD